MVSRRSRSAKGKDASSKEPLEVDLSVSVRFGAAPEDRVTVIENRRVPMVGSVFDSRDVILRGFFRMLVKAAATQPRVLSEVVPLMKLARRNR